MLADATKSVLALLAWEDTVLLLLLHRSQCAGVERIVETLEPRCTDPRDRESASCQRSLQAPLSSPSLAWLLAWADEGLECNFSSSWACSPNHHPFDEAHKLDDFLDRKRNLFLRSISVTMKTVEHPVCGLLARMLRVPRFCRTQASHRLVALLLSSNLLRSSSFGVLPPHFASGISYADRNGVAMNAVKMTEAKTDHPLQTVISLQQGSSNDLHPLRRKATLTEGVAGLPQDSPSNAHTPCYLTQAEASAGVLWEAPKGVHVILGSQSFTRKLLVCLLFQPLAITWCRA